jgi:hypothetical protein
MNGHPHITITEPPRNISYPLTTNFANLPSINGNPKTLEHLNYAFGKPINHCKSNLVIEIKIPLHVKIRITYQYIRARTKPVTSSKHIRTLRRFPQYNTAKNASHSQLHTKIHDTTTANIKCKNRHTTRMNTSNLLLLDTHYAVSQ